MPGEAAPAGGFAARPPVRALLAGVVDYAGLFPPAGLELRAAVENYASYRAGPDAWALGRFVVPAGRLQELDAAIAALGGGAGESPWRVSALLASDDATDLERARAFHESPRFRASGMLRVDVVELRVGTAEELLSRMREIPPTLTPYAEIPVEPDPSDIIRVLKQVGARAKVRTGGVTPEAFPPSGALLRFLRACVEADLPFKATAGLHHPVAGRYRLTYDRDGPSAPMYGYLNLLFATALLRQGAPEDRVAAALAEMDATAFRLAEDRLSWQEYRLGREEILALRERGMVAFGSCSFREPLDELVAVAGREWNGAPSAEGA